MRWERAEVKDLKLDGIGFEPETIFGRVVSVTLFDSHGNKVRLGVGEFNTFTILVPAHSKKVNCSRVFGTHLGEPIEKFFREESDAQEYLANLKAMVGYLEGKSLGVQIETFEVDESNVDWM